ncbi:hypothetical protein HS1genome_2002 [Sulfodiicoccus acidiphilus]|uniref:Enoyl-CoA hydratase n=1 Tax=Sulfodiicoccus acidiphilus TaxID=1670455 RepID=A0A348B611_9CREN|nr:hypothetical protein HS1genome_2002 [Sulfodiicoccus acidiphilus]
MACDLIVASKNARFGFPEIRIGLSPGGGFRKLLGNVGPYKLKELLWTGEFLTAEELYRAGVINRVVEPENLLDEAKALANSVVGAWVAVKNVKRVINETMARIFSHRDSTEAFLTSLLFNTEDGKEGLKAFIEKRSPRMKGR